MTALQARIREILMRHWDPIGVAGVPQAQDEYDSYVGAIARAVLAGRPAAAIADRLMEIETDRMGLPGDRSCALRVAEALLQLPTD